MHEKFEFLSGVAEPWTEVFYGSMFPVHFEKLEVLPRLGLKTPTLTPGVPILLWFRIVLSGDVQLRVFLLTPTLLHAKPITNVFNIFVLSGDKLLRESSTRELSRTFVTGPMPPLMTAGLKSPTPNDNLRTLSKCESLPLDRFLDQPVSWNHLSCLLAHPNHNIQNSWLLIHIYFV